MRFHILIQNTESIYRSGGLTIVGAHDNKVRFGAEGADVRKLSQAVGVGLGHFGQYDDWAFKALEGMDVGAGYTAREKTHSPSR
jgi:hypothetical protein